LPPIDNARETFRDAGLHFPLVPESLLPSFRTISRWRWGTRETSRSAYQWRWFVDEAATGLDFPQDYILVEHAGHGINSYSIHYFVVIRNLALFLQLGWGGALMPEPETRDRVNRLFSAASEVVQQADAIDPLRERHRRLVVAASDHFDGGYTRWTEDPEVDVFTARLLPVEDVLAEAHERLAQLGDAVPNGAIHKSRGEVHVVPGQGTGEPGDGEQFRVQPTAEEAWAEFERDLASTLEILEEDEYLVVERKHTDLYVQFYAQGKFGMRVEAVSNAFLEDAERLTPAACEDLVAMGWNAPTYVRVEGLPEPADGSCNFYIDVANPIPWQHVAALAVRTLREAHSARHPGDLQYSAFNEDGEAVEIDSLPIKLKVMKGAAG
jgi:hypothetical protein